jgi:hypothetical protein
MLRKLLVNCAHHILGVFGEDSDLRRWGLALVRAAEGQTGGAEAGGGSGAETGGAAASVVGDWGRI